MGNVYLNVMDCINCGDSYKYVGQHYRQSNCDYPKLSKRQLEIVEGLLMSDGSIFDDDNDRLKFVLEMKTEEFLYWVKNQLPEFTTSIKESGDYYVLRTIRAPVFREIHDKWYSGEKVFPEDIELTPLRAKMWYVGDGHYKRQSKSNNPTATIGCSNEFSNKEKLREYVNPMDVSFYSEGMWFSTESTQEFLDYIGDPVPGFEYKWGEYSG